jgi:1-phosphofructokinase family hexose kinase
VILCVAGSPSIDKLFEVERLIHGAIHRPDEFVQVPGGKGLNVARAAAALGASVVATGVLGGPAGRWIEAELASLGVAGRFVWTEGQTRSALSVADRETGSLTEFYEADAAGTPEAWVELEAAVAALLPEASWCALSGTLPSGSPPDGYARLVADAQAAGVPAAVDVRESALAEAVAAGPDLVKINVHEAEELLERPLDGLVAAAQAAREIRDLAGGDGRTAAITLGAHGAVLIDPGGEMWQGRLSVKGRYPVGCGDTFLAALLAGRERGGGWPEAMALALGASAANAELPGAGRFDPQRATELAAAAAAEIARVPA